MNAVAVAALVAAGAVAAVNWWALVARRHEVERVAKPLATALLVMVAGTAGSPDGDVRAAIVIAVVLGLIGDVVLLEDSETRFLLGLGAFAAGHTAYVVAALVGGVSWTHALIGVPFMAVLLGWRFLPETVPAARRAGGATLAGAVLGYAAIISAMVLTAAGRRSAMATAGAMLFAASDWVLGYDRFVRPVPHRELAVMVPYHVGQALLIVGLAIA